MEQGDPVEHKEWMNVIYMNQFFDFLKAKGWECRSALDIGAHKGYWSRDLKKVYPDAAITLIEPLEEMKPFLEKFCATNKNCKFHSAGAGSKPGELEFTIWPSLSGSSFIPERGDSRYETYGKRTVPVITVDQLIESGETPIPDFTKLDVQGFELEVLKGASSIMGKTEVFVIEVSLWRPLGPKMPILHEVVAFMYERGYVTYDITGFYRRRKDHALAVCDMIFVKESSPLRAYAGLQSNFDWDCRAY